ncbi:MAG TPA: hypothetical protein VFX24_12630 [Ktedonobacterales bacterium]|jgi:hypothetical protein|nr:hypothetical protein [Ktedonobacterales bacterium]
MIDSAATGVVLALAIGSVALFSLLFVAILFSMRKRWDQLGNPSDPKQPHDQHDA